MRSLSFFSHGFASTTCVMVGFRSRLIKPYLIASKDPRESSPGASIKHLSASLAHDAQQGVRAGRAKSGAPLNSTLGVYLFQMESRMKSQSKSSTELPIHHFERQQDWSTWLNENHATSPGVWLQLAKKGADTPSVSYEEAIEIALCFGWIDGQKQTHSEQFWLQKFTRRSAKSVWSKINKDKALALVKAGSMKPAGLKEIERAKIDGRWDAAYDSASKATVPSDFQSALDSNARAKDFFGTLDSRNRYAVLFRIQTAKKAETRAKKISQFVLMLERHEKVHT